MNRKEYKPQMQAFLYVLSMTLKHWKIKITVERQKTFDWTFISIRHKWRGRNSSGCCFSSLAQTLIYTLIHSVDTAYENQWGNQCVDTCTCRCFGAHTHVPSTWVIKEVLEMRSGPVSSYMQTYTSRYFIKSPVIQSTQTGWQAATCVSQVLTDSSEPTRRWSARQKSVFVSSRQAGRQAGRRWAREEEQGLWEAEIWGKQEKGRRGKLIFIHSKQVQINTSTCRHSPGRHIYRQLPVTSATS